MARRVSAKNASSSATPGVLRGDAILSGLVAAVFFARFYLPAEASAQGETLWIVGLWLLVGLVATLLHWRDGGTARRVDWLDGSVLLWIGGQIISAIVVVLTSGDKRAAVNVGWEWFGVGIVWVLLRDRVRSPSFRQAMWQASIVTGVVLAGLGLWQHYVSQPQMAAQYGPLFDRLRAASGSEAEAIKRKLAADGIPTEGPGLTLYEKRLRDSREPQGLFGLTNTFGGCLAVWLVLTLGAILVARQRGHGWILLIPLMVSAGVIVWCLLLTKSRTAWIGTVCGVMVLLARQLALTKPHRQLLAWLGGGLAVLVCVFTLLVSFGGLDREVLSEAPKSLAYRLQYWQATSRLIADHAWLGIGPGNFRQHYLRYKLPEASEEIADPHNLFLDVASTGGVLSLVGLVFIVVLALWSSRRERREDDPVIDLLSSPNRSTSIAADAERLSFWCSGLGALLVFLGQMAISGLWGDGDRLLILSCVWAGTAWLLARSWSLISNTVTDRADVSFSSIAFAGAVTLFIHLLGAGGIAMPAVSQLLLATILCSYSSVSAPVVGSRSRLSQLFVGSAIGTTFTLLLCTAIIPVARRDWWISEGDHDTGSSKSEPNDADASYGDACRADPLSSEPWRRRAEWAFQQAASQGFRSNESFDAAVKFLQETIERDPDNFQGPRTLGNWWMVRWRVTQNGDDCRQAADWLRRASDSYPTNASILAELAFALKASEQHADAVQIAERAMAQDELNRKLGHVDRYLTDDLVTQLRLQIEGVGP